jgi:hypothetical protein
MRRFLGAFTLLVLFIVDAPTAPQATTAFKGLPVVKISEGGIERIPAVVPHDQAANLECVISKISDDYYWASRENKLMVRIDGAAFITYVAIDGAGYVRVVAPGMKSSVSLMGETEEKFDYVEHLLIGLKSVTYYGVSR